jgi:hypothetical protein
MNTKLKKFLPLFALASCLSVTSVFADDTNTMTPKAQYSVAPAKNPGGDDALAFFIQAAYTYWVPYQEGNNIAFSGNAANAEPGNVIRPNVTGVSGFKVGIGANTMHDGWMVALNYAWFYNPATLQYNSLQTEGGYLPTYDSTEVDTLSPIQSQWKTQFNRIDGQLDRTFYAGHYLTFRPWLGLLGAWETQNLNLVQNANGSTVQTDTVNWEQSWWGIGPYAGTEGAFYFTNEWALYITSGASLLLSNHSLTQYELQGGGLSYNLKDNFYNVEPMIESMLGLRWDSFWTDWALCIDLAWDMQTYFSHNGFQNYNNPMGVMGNYSMQGLTASVKVSF